MAWLAINNSMAENEREFPKVENWTAMRALIKANLGSPLICVELSEYQLNNAIQDAVLFMQEYWGSGSFKDVMPIKLLKNQREYKIEDEGILAVTEIVGAASTASDDYDDGRPFTLERLIAKAVPAPSQHPPLNSSMGITDIESMMQGMREWNFRYSAPFVPRWNGLDKTLIVEPTPMHDMNAALLFWRKEKIANLFNTIQFRRLATAYAGIQWATNLGKITIALPGGAALNATTMKTDFAAERDRWETQIKKEYASNFIVG